MRKTLWVVYEKYYLKKIKILIMTRDKFNQQMEAEVNFHILHKAQK